MYQLVREGGFVPSNSRDGVQKVYYRRDDGVRIKLHVSRNRPDKQGRISPRHEFVVSAGLADEIGIAKQANGTLLVGHDKPVTIETSNGATLDEMKPFLLFELPEAPPEKEGYLWAEPSETGVSVKRFDGTAWQPWLEMPSGATAAQILLADQLEHGMRTVALSILDEGEKALAIDSLVPGL